MRIQTQLTDMLGIRFPIIGAPMFLVSNVEMVKSISKAGGIGTFPALNFRPINEYKNALIDLSQDSKLPFGVNVIVNQSNSRQSEDVDLALQYGAKVIITSLGNPKDVIRKAHENKALVFCDVTNLSHAKKAQDLGADAVIAVASGAGGHAGPISPIVLIPWLRKELKIPVIAAGGIADGVSMAGALALGAVGVSIGTRFIASHEAQVSDSYKTAIVKSGPEDIVMTSQISGTPASVILTDSVRKMGSDLNPILKFLKEQPQAKKIIVPLIHYLGMKKLEDSGRKGSWKDVWSAGQSVGLVDKVQSCSEIIEQMVQEYSACKQKMPNLIIED